MCISVKQRDLVFNALQHSQTKISTNRYRLLIVILSLKCEETVARPRFLRAAFI